MIHKSNCSKVIALTFMKSHNEMTSSEFKPMTELRVGVIFIVEPYEAFLRSKSKLNVLCPPMTPATESHLITLRAIFSLEPISGARRN